VDDDTLIRCETAILSPTATEYPDVLDHAGKDLLQRIKRWAKRNGYYVAGHNSFTIHDGSTFTVMLTVEGYLRPRYDGEWASIWRAFQEDQEALQGLVAPRRHRPSIPSAWRL
jgi:hypothetical protein